MRDHIKLKTQHLNQSYGVTQRRIKQHNLTLETQQVEIERLILDAHIAQQLNQLQDYNQQLLFFLTQLPALMTDGIYIEQLNIDQLYVYLTGCMHEQFQLDPLLKKLKSTPLIHSISVSSLTNQSQKCGAQVVTLSFELTNPSTLNQQNHHKE